MKTHLEKLAVIFPKAPVARTMAPAAFIRALKRLEREGQKLAEDTCNEPLPEGYAERAEKSILDRLDALIGFRAARVPVFLNLDPRGYALKISDMHMRAHSLDLQQDWGGYGIICPEEIDERKG